MEAFKIYVIYFDFIISHKESTKIFERGNDMQRDRSGGNTKDGLWENGGPLRKLGQCSI